MIPHSKPTIGIEEINAVRAVLRKGYISQGPAVRRLEQGFGRYISRRYAVAVNSATSALHLALLALRIKPGDEVILPSYVCTAVLNAINYVGARAIIADINPQDFNLDPKSCRSKITRRTKAIILPHMFGLAAEIDKILGFGVPVIEDCALSVGATYRNKKVGSFGIISVFSFYATKVMTTAEGGMLLTDDKNIFATALDLRDYDHKERYRVRYNYKMSDLAAAVGLAQLNKLDNFISRRQRLAQFYNKNLKDLDIQLPVSGKERRHIYFRYVIRTRLRAQALMRKFSRLGIECKRPLFRPLHIYLRLKNKDYPGATQAYKEAVSLPIYPDLKGSQAQFVISGVRKALG
jgi:dTDP-4-amino-4,6-dideoxygalactose transaminase